MDKVIAAFVLFMLATGSAGATPAIKKYVPNAQVVGTGTLKYLVWNVYKAKLYAPSGKWRFSKPFALSLIYLRALTGADIADRSVQEIRKLGFRGEVKLAAWHSQMRRIFPDVGEGARLTGIHTPGGPTRFFKGSSFIGSIHDPEFGKWFFGIWLNAKTSEPDLRRQLLGKR